MVLSSVPALADDLTVHIRDRDALLVGEPTDTTDAHVDTKTPVAPVDVGTAKSYTFTIQSPNNRLEIDLEYDNGAGTPSGPCLRANDLDLYVDGPGDWQTNYPGCDSGKLTFLESAVPAGDYEVRVDADHGTTSCVPEEPSNPCTAPAVEYELLIQVWDLDG